MIHNSRESERRAAMESLAKELDRFRSVVEAMKTDPSKVSELRAMVPSLAKAGERFQAAHKAVEDQIVDTSYAKELANLTDSEAIEYLRLVDESHVAGAYLVLSKRLDPRVLAEICLGYMGRPEFRVRDTGVIGIGLCLKRTRDSVACRALAAIARNPKEPEEIRSAAEASLALINAGTKGVNKIP